MKQVPGPTPRSGAETDAERNPQNLQQKFSFFQQSPPLRKLFALHGVRPQTPTELAHILRSEEGIYGNLAKNVEAEFAEFLKSVPQFPKNSPKKIRAEIFPGAFVAISAGLFDALELSRPRDSDADCELTSEF